MRRTVVIILVILLTISLFLFFIARTKRSLGPLQNRLSKVRLLVKDGKLKEAEEGYKKIIVDFKDSKDLVVVMDELTDIYRLQNQLLKAKELYTDIIHRYPESDRISQIQQKLWDLNIEIIFSALITDYSTIYEVKPNDILNRIAKKFKTTVDLIMKSNDLKNHIIRPYDRLKIITADFSIIVDKSQNTLTLKTNDEVIKIYSVSTGRNNYTPVGEFKIIDKLKNPVWYKAGAIVPAESPENILGSRWMGLSKKGYGIHGSTDETSIGKQVTQGCIRMKNKDVEELYIIVPQNAKVIIVD